MPGTERRWNSQTAPGHVAPVAVQDESPKKLLHRVIPADLGLTRILRKFQPAVGLLLPPRMAHPSTSGFSAIAQSEAAGLLPIHAPRDRTLDRRGPKTAERKRMVAPLRRVALLASFSGTVPECTNVARAQRRGRDHK